jgi:hypothetical protein
MIDEFLQVQATLPSGGRRWWWDSVNLTDEQKAAVIEAIGRPDVSDNAVRLVLGKWGVQVTQAQVAHMRRKLTDG